MTEVSRKLVDQASLGEQPVPPPWQAMPRHDPCRVCKSHSYSLEFLNPCVLLELISPIPRIILQNVFSLSQGLQFEQYGTRLRLK